MYTSFDSVYFSVCDTRVSNRLQNSRIFASKKHGHFRKRKLNAHLARKDDYARPIALNKTPKRLFCMTVPHMKALAALVRMVQWFIYFTLFT